VNKLVPFTDRAPALIAAAGKRASYRLSEFFTAQIRNPNTRRAYARGAKEFCDWLAARVVRTPQQGQFAREIARGPSGLPTPIQKQANRGFEPPIVVREFLAAAQQSQALR
jgi:hypothetical protein